MADRVSPDAQKAFLQRARKGVVKFVVDQEGKAALGDMHNFSQKKFFIGHQSFSKLMESLVDEKLIEFDQSTGTATATVTEVGRAFAAKL